jgi:hypothetical protein
VSLRSCLPLLRRLLQGARYAWAAPCSLVGLLLALPLMIAGARARRVNGVLEVGFTQHLMQQGLLANKLPFSAITLGHVVLGLSQHELTRLRTHEHAHVRQYERWGVLFFVAYPLSSLVQWLLGRSPYWHNRFEIQARAQEARAAVQGASADRARCAQTIERPGDRLAGAPE